MLCDHFVEKYSEANGVELRSIAEATRAELLRYAWPGNVRELENTMHRAVVLATADTIEPEAIMLPDGSDPEAARPLSATTDAEVAADTVGLVGRTVAAVERDLIIDTLSHCLGNRTHAAKILGISIRTLRNKLNQYAVEGRHVPVPGVGSQPAL